MNPANNFSGKSVFRTEHWVQAWIDTWGKDPRIRLLDLGGRGDPLEQVYLIKHRLKKILPVNTLCLAGVGFAAMSTPRAEYNNLDSLIAMAGNIKTLKLELAKLKWQQFAITDIDTTSSALAQIEELVRDTSWYIHTENTESAYSIRQTTFENYLENLGPNTRLAYFNRCERLAQQGELGFVEYALHQAPEFFNHLNQFHLQRWGVPCYSAESQRFMENFIGRLNAAGGRAVMQGITVNGEVVSVLFDICWGNTRYNFQSGYAENRFAKISLGALHFGYAIQAVLEQGQDYDFMAGTGKHSNYKQKISNFQLNFNSLRIEKAVIALLKTLF